MDLRTGSKSLGCTLQQHHYSLLLASNTVVVMLSSSPSVVSCAGFLVQHTSTIGALLTPWNRSNSHGSWEEAAQGDLTPIYNLTPLDA